VAIADRAIPLTAEVSPVDAVADQRALRKVSRRILPLLMVLYLGNYLDRTNIGFAKLAMNADLGLSETAFGLASGVFFLGYVAFEVPSNLLLHRLGARVWITRIMATWGLVAAVMAFVPNATMLYVLRALLGIAEAGFAAGILLYLTHWFPARRRTQATAWFYAVLPLSSVIGAPLSALLMQYGDGVLGLAGWRFMYLVEGLPAVAFAVVVWCALTDKPQDATWLSAAEKKVLTTALVRETPENAPAISVRRMLTHPRVLLLGLAFFGPVYGLYALGYFLPSIIHGFQAHYGVQYSLLQVGLLTAIPYAIAAVAMVAWSRHSDRTGEHTWHVVLPALLAAVAIPVALYMPHPVLTLAVFTLGVIGVMATIPTFWSLTAFLAGRAAAAGIATILAISNLGGFFAPYLTGWLTAATGTPRTGMWLTGATLADAAAICLAMKRTMGR
jgi:MFS family permease